MLGTSPTLLRRFPHQPHVPVLATATEQQSNSCRTAGHRGDCSGNLYDRSLMEDDPKAGVTAFDNLSAEAKALLMSELVRRTHAKSVDTLPTKPTDVEAKEDW